MIVDSRKMIGRLMSLYRRYSTQPISGLARSNYPIAELLRLPIPGHYYIVLQKSVQKPG